MHPFQPPKPPCPPCHAPAQGYLLQRIIAFDKRSIPCLCTEWCFDPCVSGCIQYVFLAAPPTWSIENDHELHVTIPLNVQLHDACGHSHTRNASLDLDTSLPRSMACKWNEPGLTLFILPCVRLLRAESSCEGCFRVQLAVSLDLYLLRYEAVRCPPPKPSCPQLPLYHPPVC